MSSFDIVDESFIRLTQLQIKTIKRLKDSALQNKKYAPNDSYIQGFVKACDLIIEIIDDPITKLTKGDLKND